MSKHTPGPWTVHQCGFIVNSAEDERAIAYMAPRDQVANTRLIAAAPDLLTLVDNINNWLVCSAICTPEDMAQSFEAFQRECDRVITKARGEA